MRENDAHLVESHALYIQAFMDWMQSWVSRNGNQLKEFLRAWDEKNAASPVKIASPASTDAVRIITIHKSKGLEFPYIIIPYFEDIKFFRSGNVWAEPSVPSSSENKAVMDFDNAIKEGIFKPMISSASAQTYFAPVYNRERLYQCIDALNLMYVAMTRPSRGLHIICGGTSSGFNKEGTINTASDALMAFALEHSGNISGLEGSVDSIGETASAAGASGTINFSVAESDWGVDYIAGKFCGDSDLEFRNAGKKAKSYRKDFSQSVLQSGYPSYTTESSRLRIDHDAADFFSSDGTVGPDASRRLRGIVLHNILSSVVVLEDLKPAIDKAVDSGELTALQADEVFGLLSRRILNAQSRGWFSESPDEVLNERPLATAEGESLRPDRVSIRNGEVLIIDYKFGRSHPSYLDQVRSYMETYRSLGYATVRGYLWFVPDDKVFEVLDE